MGSSIYSSAVYTSHVQQRAAMNKPVFEHSLQVEQGLATGVHPSLNPLGVKLRESRDSASHPVTVPIAVIMDTTGSMAKTPPILEASLNRLMGLFLDAKQSGKSYLGEGYPAVLIAAVDDYAAMTGGGYSPSECGALQVGQFESGIEIDLDLERVWLTKRGGGTYEESYELGLYFLARHTAHDHGEKRGRKGYAFIVGDEHAYPQVDPQQVKAVIGDDLAAPIALADVVAEVQQRYNLFFVIPAFTQHFGDPGLIRYWEKLLGQQNVLKLEDPSKLSELIAGAVAMHEEFVGAEDLKADGVAEDVVVALAPFAAAGKAGKQEAAAP